MRLAFSKPTRNADEQQILFSRFRSFGFAGLQLKQSQYWGDLDHPEHFVERWGQDAPAIASGLIMQGSLDEAGIALLRRVFTFAQVVGAERIIFCHSQPRQGLSRADITSFARLLSDLGKEARQHATSLSLHHHYNQPVMYREDFEVFFASVDDQSIGLTVDTAHLVKSGIVDIAGIMREYRHVLDNIHLKDILGGIFTLPGQGSINFQPVFETLHQIDFSGWLCSDEESQSELLEAMEISNQFLSSAQQ